MSGTTGDANEVRDRLSVPPLALWLGRRIVMLVPLLIIVSFVTFSLIAFIPGDPALALAGDSASPEVVEAIREQIGANKPFLVRYSEWASDALRGDLGKSLFSPVPVVSLITQRLPVTLSLAGVSIVLAVVVGSLLGLLAAVFRGGAVDRLVVGVASLGIAVPTFWLGMMLVYAFAIHWSWLPAVGYTPLTENPAEWLRHLALPSIALAATPTAEIARQLRASLVNVLDEDYVRTARANGLSQKSVILKHALKNSAISVVTVIGIQAAFLLGGSVIIEKIFGLPGVGSLALVAVLQRDLPVIQGVVLATALIVLIVNTIVDLNYGLLNPRARA